ncbi:hypothetical protein [Microbacterium sp. CJ88]|uniref:hypothetical protein n=1 Tax=Microbacterium sp. CJ88 TaxID=3445672 RepID=UPI003F658064
MTTSPRRRVLALAAALALSALAFVGCASTTAGSNPTTDASTPTPVGELAAAWLDDGRAIGIVTWGSSTCIPVAGEPVFKDGVLTIGLSDVEGQVCTQDYVARGTLVTLPAGVDPAKELKVAVTGAYAGDLVVAGDATLAPAAAVEYLPTAGWFSSDGFLVLTWGSSTCVPQLEKAVASGKAEVTATFVTPPADQVCTADMGPRVTVGAVTGLEATSSVHLVLAGGGLDGMQVSIVGTR